MAAEVYWLFNFFMDALLLWCACALSCVRPRPRLLLSAALGAAFAVLCQYAPFLLRFSLPAALAMVLACAGPQPPRRVVLLTLVLYGLTFLLGGCGSCALLALGRRGVRPGLLLPAAVSLLSALGLCACLPRLTLLRGLPFQATLRVTGKRHTAVLPAVVDSGNRLCDPLTLLPVIALGDGSLKADLIDTGRTVRFTGVGGEGRMRLYRAKRVEVAQNGRWHLLPDAYFACPPGPGTHPALLPATLLPLRPRR